jgi:predicted secreted hydrolase
MPAPRVFLPQDDASHALNTEWWYYNGHLLTEDGSRYGFHLVLFQVQAPGGSILNIGHFALTDHGRRTYATAQQITLRLLEPPQQGFRVTVGDMEASGAGGEDTLIATAGQYTLRLRLSPGKPAALHDGDGLVEFPLAGDSFYYSRTRMPGAGALVDHGQERRVQAQAWMDHQWGNFALVAIGWDWFSLQLDDATELMLSVTRDRVGKELMRYGTLVAADGKVVHLDSGAFRVEATGSWTSPTTGTVYPSGWRLSLPGLGLSLGVAPVLQSAEFDSRATTQSPYWEGEVTVQGQKNGAPLSGLGFVELVGY